MPIKCAIVFLFLYRLDGASQPKHLFIDVEGKKTSPKVHIKKI